MTDVVVLSGKQGSGKTSISNELKRQAPLLKYEFVNTVKFADPLYELHDVILNKMERWTGIPRVDKDGLLLQVLGTEWGRKAFGVNVWADIAFNKYKEWDEKMTNSKTLLIIDDCRFENEFDKFGIGLRVRLECPEEVRKIRTHAWRENTRHPSEVGLDEYSAAGKFDLYLDTNGDALAHCVSLINAQLQKKSWAEKRK